MANWIRIATVSEIPAGQCKVYEAAGNQVAVFHVEGGYHALDNSCIHRGGPLGEGQIQGVMVTCPWHFWNYDVRTGRTRMNETAGVRTYPLEIRGDDVFVDVS